MKKLLAVLIAALLVLGVFAGCSGTEGGGEQSGSEIVLKIGEMEFTKSEMDFMYVSAFNEIYSNLYSYYGSYLSSVVDISVPLEDQMVSDGLTWHQYVIDYTVDTLVNLTGLYEAAIAEGFVLPEKYQTDLDGIETQLTEVATESDMTLEEYIAFMYGEGITMENIYEMTEFRYIAGAYAEEYEAALTVTEDEIDTYYQENKNAIDTVDFRYFSFFYAEEADEENGYLLKEDAETRANSMAEVHTAEEFNALGYEYASEDQKSYFTEGNDPTIFPGASYDSTGIEEVSDWLFDEARQQGDTMVYHDETYQSYLVVMFEERIDPDYSFVDVRHILIMPEEDEEGNAGEEAWAAAEAKANEIYEEYLAGEMTEEAFSALAAEHSGDGNASTGGIYENVYKGQMVAPFENWCFDETRKPGDTGIVETSFGYHIMYFVGLGDNNLVSLVEPTVLQQKINDWVEECCLGMEAEKLEGFDLVGGMIDDIVNAANAMAEEQAAASSENSEESASGESGNESESSSSMETVSK
ncbi:MAG: peptidylprolyl isomerase [Oscillospiraceae bacterium]|nr:peptidylprolyl isomerase [Oscillospiraceae bacterium]